VRLTEKGEMRMSPGARWIPFTAEETIEARQSEFVWRAHFLSGRVLPVLVTDAYEKGQGRLLVQLGGVLDAVNARGPEVDRAELQRCLADVLRCPPRLLVHPTLDWNPVGPGTLRVRDTMDAMGATIDIDLGEDGCPFRCRAERPRQAGRKAIATPWSACAQDFHQWEGLRVPRQVEAAWHLPGGVFAYFRGEVTSFAAER
jgi:hypothetical protein